MNVMLARHALQHTDQGWQPTLRYRPAKLLRNADGSYTVMDLTQDNVLIDHMTPEFMQTLRDKQWLLLDPAESLPVVPASSTNPEENAP